MTLQCLKTWGTCPWICASSSAIRSPPVNEAVCSSSAMCALCHVRGHTLGVRCARLVKDAQTPISNYVTRFCKGRTVSLDLAHPHHQQPRHFVDWSCIVWALVGSILWRSIPCCALLEGRWIRLGEIADNPSDRDLIWGTSRARGRRQVTKATNWTLADLSIESIMFATTPFLDTISNINVAHDD